MSFITFGLSTDLQIAGNLTINTLNGVLKATAGAVSVATAGTDYSTPAQLTSSGVQLGTSIATSGQQAWLAANANGVNLSGNLTATGAALFARDAAISGGLQVQIAQSGQQAWISANGSAAALSGALTQTGVQLIAAIAAASGDLAFGNPTRSFMAKTYQVTVSGVNIPPIGPSLTGVYNIDFNSPGLQTLTVTGATLISGVNYINGGAVTVRINATGAAAALRFPATWTNGWVTAVPTGIATGRFAVLTLNSFAAVESGLMIAFAVAS